MSGASASPFVSCSCLLLARLRASWSAGTPRLRLVCTHSSTRPHVWWSLTALFRASISSGTVSSAAVHEWTDVLVFLHFGFVRPAIEVRTERVGTIYATHGVVLTIFRVINVHFETDLHFFGLLILLHLPGSSELASARSLGLWQPHR